MKLNRIISGTAGDRPPVLLAHGVLGSARNLGILARRLDGRRVVQVDMRNHADSPWSEIEDYPAMAADLAGVIADEGGPADVVGHSMGGKAAMALALSRPELVRRLVVMDIAPVRYAQDNRDLIHAMQAIDLAAVRRRAEADAQLAARVPDAGIRAFLLQSLDVSTTPPRWKMNLAALDKAIGTLSGWPDTLRPGAFGGPVLLLCGELSPYVDASGREAMRAWFPQVETVTIPGAGHWLHAEQPRPVGDAVADFLDRADAG